MVAIVGPVSAQGSREADSKAAGRVPEATRTQERGLRPPQDVLNEKDAGAANESYQPTGIDLGPFLMLPKIEVEETYNDNVFAKQHAAEGDFVTTVRPEMALRSRFDTHELNGLARVERKEYARFDSDTVTEFLAQSDGRYDLNKTDTLRGLISYSLGHEDRGSPDEAGGIRPTPYSYLTGRTGGTWGFGRLTSALDISAIQRSYEDVAKTGGTVANHLRDRDEYEEKLRESYEVIPGYFAVLEGATNQRVYDAAVDANGFNRDSQGWRINGGLGVDISQLVRGDFLVGYFRQDYSDGNLQDPNGLSVKAMFNWTPTRMTLVVPSFDRAVEETTASGVAALVRTSTSVFVRHELKRNVILSSSLSYAHDSQEGGDQDTDTYEGQVRGTYLFNPNLYLGAELGMKRKLSNTDGAGFNQHMGMLRLGAQY